ncbi:hypothetical protein NXY56_002763 [Leishmania guyanensis]|uniref:Uncharacterized protein n=1 Tax=Leishmania guyanensis TaxID=5670 RepID=A0A1E1IWB4_LEIGU|nr:hypothetical protein, conserved [Leishmania guyanensis]
MKSIHSGGRIAATTCVHVEVKGSLDIPLNLGLLADLGDPMMEQEIIKEAVRIAVSERLGYFGGVEVQLSSSGGLEGCREVTSPKAMPKEAQIQHQEEAIVSSHSHDINKDCRRRYCEASVNLDELGRCVESIQKAYEGLLAHAQLLHELLNADTAGSTAGAAVVAASPTLSSSAVTELASAITPKSQQLNEVDAHADALKLLAAVRQLVVDMVAEHRPDVVAEAVALKNGASSQRLASHEADMLVEEHAETTAAIHTRRDGKWSSHGDDRNGAEGPDKDDDLDAGLRFGLLAGGNEDAEAQQHQQAEDTEDEEVLRARYIELGYSPL